MSGKSQENGPLTEGKRKERKKLQDRKSERTRQKNKRRGRKEESNDSPEISDKHGLPLGFKIAATVDTFSECNFCH